MEEQDEDEGQEKQEEDEQERVGAHGSSALIQRSYDDVDYRWMQLAGTEATHNPDAAREPAIR